MGTTEAGIVKGIVDRRIVEIRVNDLVENAAGRCGRLLPSDWDKADFRFPNSIPGWETVHGIAMNIKITGRTFRRRGGRYWVKVQLEWIGDSEPSTFTEGWVEKNPFDCEYIEL